jgi:TolB-like protein/Tfp pilus assembly protein PilF
MALSPRSCLGPYEIVAPLGAGGMGEVYRARDKKLDRDVAVKVLPQSVAADPDTLARFEREAKAVAALSHPNILAIHDFGNQDGIAYAVMELLEGETLRGKLDKGPITQKQAVDYALQVVKGLSAAHEKAIVHRDLKPENLFVSRDGHVKILDFGLAKRVEAVAPGKETSAPTGSGHTEPGTVMGTVGYMSPEQVKGLQVDHRSDIFSFGAILYELLSGQKAFKRDTNAETMAAILRDEPPELSESVRSISPALDRIVKHCLEKDRERRFQTARDIAFSLSEQFSPMVTSGARETTPPVSPAGLSVAVLPFKYSGADADLAALADGLSEEIVTGLSRFRYLSVVSSASVDRLTGDAGDERAPGAQLDARYVLEGSIRKGGSAIRVSAQLVDAQTGAKLWAETYNQDLQTSSIFAVQDDVAARIVATVADSYGVLVHSMRSAMRQKDDVHLTPVEWQFQYFAYREQITPSAYAELKSRLERAVERDGRQSDLWACLAQIFVDEYAFGFGTDPAALDRALSAARRAVELDRANQFALVALAQTHFFRQDLAAFGPAAERAMTLNPLNTDAVGILGLQIVHTGEFERGAAIVRRAMELNANHAGWMHFAPLWEHFHKEEYEQALERANRVDVPGLFWPYLVVASACGHLGRRAEAAAAVRDLLALDPEFAAHARSNVGTWHFASGLMDPILEGLRKAGLSIPATDGSADLEGRIGTVTTKADRARSGTGSAQVRAEEGFWVAVLPFKSSGANAEIAALAEGITEDIVTGLSRFSYLKVIARSRTARYASEGVTVRSAGEELGARYVMEGSLRQVGATIRLAVQLVDAMSGAHLWAETFDRASRPEEILDLQDELVPRIVSTVADQHGILTRSISAAVRKKSDDELSPYEAVFRVFGLHERMTPQEHANVRELLERVVRDAPDHGDSWAMLATTYSDEFMFGFNVRPDPLGRALAAAQRAVEAAPASPLASQALAQALFFRRERQAFRPLAERTIALNRMDGATMAFMGILLACAGDWEHGCAVADSAMRLNPHFPGWYWLAAIFNAYRTRDYRAAIDAALRIQMPGYFWTSLTCAAAFGQLGEQEPARKALEELLAVRPEFARAAHEELGKWFDPDLVEHFVDGLRKAGLGIAPEKGPAASATAPEPAGPSAREPSGSVRAEEGFWVAVLPFKYGGADSNLTALAEGLTEDIVTGLSRFSYLRVIARSSTAHLVNQAADVRSAGKELGARYVMEGSLRQAGTKVRLAVQLVDTTSGSHLWAEVYDRPLNPEAAFELQDDLVPRIVSTCADRFGVLARSISDAVRGREPGQLGPYEALLRGFGYHQRLTPAEHAEAREALELAVERAPSNADCWAMLSWIYSHEHAHGFNARPGSLDRALAAARRAVDIAPSNQLAQQALAVVLFFRKETAGCLSAAERAIALNPLDTSNEAMFLITFSGDWDRGCALIRRAMELNPHHPRWYGTVLSINEYRLANYRAVVDEVVKANAPDIFWTNMLLTAAYGQLGELTAARNALRDLIAQKEDFARSAGELVGKWFDPQLVGHLIEGLRKAGLDAPLEKSAGTPARESSDVSASVSGAVRTDEGFWVAVLPFKYSGNNAELTALAEGLTEDTVTGLSRFSYLRVIARSSTSRYANESVDVRTAGKELGARYVMEGSLRQAGTKLRLAVQLVDALSGAHLWAENFERTFSPETVFELQDDLVPRIVSTVADMYGVLTRSMNEALRGKADEELSPHEAVLSAFGYMERVTPEEHARVRRILERAVSIAPNQSDAWAMLANLYWEEYAHGLNPQPDPLGRALAAARRAVEAAPSSNLAHYALACTLFFQKDFLAFRSAAERAIELNRMDASVAALIGNLIAYAGDWERGCAVVESAMRLNPHHPGWYWFVSFNDAYRRRDYRGALGFALKFNQPGNFYTHAVIAQTYGQLGMREEARKSLQELLAIRPDFARTAREEYGRWFHDLAIVEHQLDGLRKAGLEIPALTRSSATDSGADRADEGFWVAVLPFRSSGPAADLTALAEGLTEDVVTGLSRFSYLRVIARGSKSLRYTDQARDLRIVGKELGARYVMEGNLRQAGTKLRLAVQLVDAVSGAHLWAENYERTFRSEAVFELQDDLVPRIVSTVADMNGVLPRSMSETVRRRSPEELSPYEAVLRSFGYFERVSAEELAAARSGLELAVRKAPAHADAWAMLALLCVQDYAQGFNLQADSLASGLAAARRAVETAPSSPLAYFSLAQALFFQREFPGFRHAAERAVALNPSDGNSIAFIGELLTYAGDWERGMALAERAKQLNPHHPGWYWYADFYNAYRQGDDRGALSFALKINLPRHWPAHMVMAAAYGQLGERDAAARAVRDLLKVRPDFAARVREDIEKWWDPEYVDRLIDGVRKAGLDVPPSVLGRS